MLELEASVIKKDKEYIQLIENRANNYPTRRTNPENTINLVKELLKNSPSEIENIFYSKPEFLGFPPIKDGGFAERHKKYANFKWKLQNIQSPKNEIRILTYQINGETVKFQLEKRYNVWYVSPFNSEMPGRN